MATNITFRKTDSALNKPSATTVKNAPLSSLEIDGNFKSIKDNLDEMIEGGVGKLVQRHDVVSLGGQTIFDLPFSYTPGMDALMVFVNGVLGVTGSRYTETSSTRITMTPALALGDKVTVMANVSPINNLPYNPVDGRKDLFVAGTHYTKNTTTSVTLSSAPAKSGTVKVFFDGIYQNKDTYYIVGNVVYFGVVGSLVAIPVDTVEVQYEIPSQFVGLSVEDNAVLTAAQNNALSSANAAAASFDSFDDRYLGAKNVAPTVDNDGNTILVGAKYFNSTENKTYIRNSSNAWQLDTAESSAVNYLPAGTGAVATTVQSKLRESISPEDYGAVGNGEANDTDAVQKALQYACANGTSFRGSGGIYKIIGAVNVNHSVGRPVDIDWCGSTIVAENANIIIAGPAAFLSTSLVDGAYPKIGDPKIKLASIVGIRQGDLIGITSSAMMHGTLPALHYYLVSEVDVENSEVYIEGTVCADINPTQINFTGPLPEAVSQHGIFVTVSHLTPGITFKNANFIVTDTAGNRSTVSLGGHYRVTTTNLSFSGHTRNHLVFHYNGHTLSENIYVRDFGYINKNIGYANLPAGSNTSGSPITNSPSTGDAGLSYGYGIALARNYSSVVRNLVAGHGWHASDVARGQMHILYDSVICARNGYGLKSHGGVWNATYINCELRGTSGMLVSGINNLTVSNCNFKSVTVHGLIHGQHLSLRIVGNRFYMPNPDTTNHACATAWPNVPISAGAISDGDSHLIHAANNVIEGWALVSFGVMRVPTLKGNTYCENNIVVKGNLNVETLPNTVFTGNKITNYTQVPCIFHAPDDLKSLVINNNVISGSMNPNLPANLVSNAFSINGTTSLTDAFIEVANNTSNAGRLVNSTTASKITSIKGNTHTGGSFIVLGPVGLTVTVMKDNIYYGYLQYQTTVTNNINNLSFTL